MAVTPSGFQSLPLEYLRNLIASSATFQTWVEAASETAALPFIGYGESDSKASNGRFAVVGKPGVGENRPISSLSVVGADNDAEHSGMLLMMFEGEVDPEQTVAEQRMTMDNTMGAIVAEMLDNRGGSGAAGVRLVFDDIDNDYMLFIDPDDRPDKNVDAIETGYTVTFGRSPAR